jgi:dienelactone hydrolase
MGFTGRARGSAPAQAACVACGGPLGNRKSRRAPPSATRVHAFHNDTRPEIYDPEAARDAWARTIASLRQHLDS